MDQVLFVLFTILLGTVTCSPTPGVKYTLYGVQKTWNEARTLCETQGQVMLKLDTREKFTNFMAFLDLWLNSHYLENDLWTGLHRHIITDLVTYNLEWYDCEPLGEWTNWATGEPDNQDTELCIRLLISSFAFRTRECNFEFQVVCQQNTVCLYEEYQKKTVVDVNLASRFNDTLEGCKQFCLDFSVSGDECVLITFSGNPHGLCNIYTRSSVFVQNQPSMTEEQGTNVFVKRCVFGEYHSTAPLVETNTASEPITVCPSSAETLSFSSSSSSSTDIPSTSSTLNLYSENIQQTDMTTENIDQQSQTFDESFSSVLGSAHFTQLWPSKGYFTSADEHLDTTVVSSMHSNTETGVTESTPVRATPPLQSTPVHTTPPLQSTPVRTTPPLQFDSDTPLGTILPSSLAVEETTSLQTSLVYNLTTVTNNMHQNGTTTNALCPCFCGVKQQDFSVIYNSLKTILDKKSLSSYWRSKNSAQDDRMSAQAIGSSGIIVIIVVFFVIVCMDLNKLQGTNRRR